jgi:hypothetical protein
MSGSAKACSLLSGRSDCRWLGHDKRVFFSEPPLLDPNRSRLDGRQRHDDRANQRGARDIAPGRLSAGLGAGPQGEFRAERVFPTVVWWQPQWHGYEVVAAGFRLLCSLCENRNPGARDLVFRCRRFTFNSKMLMPAHSATSSRAPVKAVPGSEQLWDDNPAHPRGYVMAKITAIGPSLAAAARLLATREGHANSAANPVS